MAISVPARVPGDVYSDLYAADVITSPMFGENDVKESWIGEHDWMYTRMIHVDNMTMQSVGHAQTIRLFCFMSCIVISVN